MKTTTNICFNLRNSWHQIARMYNSYGSEHDVSVSMAYVLLVLDRTQGTPSTQIAPTLGMEASSLTRLLKSLEDKKLIVKKVDKKDGRQVNIFLTAKGEEKKAIAQKTVEGFNDILRKAIPPERLEIFLSTLDEINRLSEVNFKQK